ncbi:MAG TPA: hypothetical protein VK571_09140 [Gemmatimonadaceae bacterium]|nr:hypothetical protein [Gemmatimonadaceae bacterium]
MPTTDELERRIDRLEERNGQFLRMASGIEASQTLILEWLVRIEGRVGERSGIELDNLRRGLDSLRARTREGTPVTLRELELIGPTWLGKAKLSGFSGVTIVFVVVVGLAGLIAWRMLR